MTPQEIRLLREKELAFFGTVSASLSHEINNVVAIVGELTGLLDDLLSAAEQGRPLNAEKLKDISGKLAKQVKKGEVIIKRLNRFAHSVDQPVKQIDLKELLLQISTIAERFAFLKGITLEPHLADGSCMMETKPFSLQQAVFLCIQIALDTAGKNDIIKISCQKEDSRMRIFLSGFAIPETDEVNSRTEVLSLLMKELQGEFDMASAGGDYSIALSLPCALPE